MPPEGRGVTRPPDDRGYGHGRANGVSKRSPAVLPLGCVEIRPLFSQTCTARIQKFPDGSGSPQMFLDVSKCVQKFLEVSRCF
eukprot:jgi/Chrzof1/8024/UNPLg00911.t1